MVLIASVCGPELRTEMHAHAEFVANARLIAAAPAMLDALKWSESCFIPFIYAHSIEEREHVLKDAIHSLDRIRAAIAKTEGTS